MVCRRIAENPGPQLGLTVVRAGNPEKLTLMFSCWTSGWVFRAPRADAANQGPSALEVLSVLPIDTKATVLVTRAAHRPSWIEFVFNLDGLAPR